MKLTRRQLLKEAATLGLLSSPFILFGIIEGVRGHGTSWTKKGTYIELHIKGKGPVIFHNQDSSLIYDENHVEGWGHVYNTDFSLRNYKIALSYPDNYLRIGDNITNIPFSPKYIDGYKDSFWVYSLVPIPEFVITYKKLFGQAALKIRDGYPQTSIYLHTDPPLKKFFSFMPQNRRIDIVLNKAISQLGLWHELSHWLWNLLPSENKKPIYQLYLKLSEKGFDAVDESTTLKLENSVGHPKDNPSELFASLLTSHRFARITLYREELIKALGKDVYKLLQESQF